MHAPEPSPDDPSRALLGTDGFDCLVIEDDTGFANMVAEVVKGQGGRPVVCTSLEAARRATTGRQYDLVILDNYLPDGTGYEFFLKLCRYHPETLGIMITGVPELATAIELTRNGLFDYLPKPVDVPTLQACLQRCRRHWLHPDTAGVLHEMVGSSPAIRGVHQQLQQAARHAGATVLLVGETGTGKDLTARLLHRLTYASTNPSAPYVASNCSAVPSEMFEAELFGSERGAYTGANRRRTGLIEAAEGGTLFLDEVADIPQALQPKLLRFLESKEYRLLGSTNPCRYTGRVVAATNRSLQEEVDRGRFRLDLMYRLDVFQIRLPPLRERAADIGALAEFLLADMCQKYSRGRLRLRPEDLAALGRYRFPGNVRELRNLVERSLLKTPESSAWLVMDLGWMRELSDTPANSLIPASAPPKPAGRQLTALEQQEYDLIEATLHEQGGGIRRAAAKLGLTHQSLLRRLQKWPELRSRPSMGDPGAEHHGAPPTVM